MKNVCGFFFSFFIIILNVNHSQQEVVKRSDGLFWSKLLEKEMMPSKQKEQIDYTFYTTSELQIDIDFPVTLL